MTLQARNVETPQDGRDAQQPGFPTAAGAAKLAQDRLNSRVCSPPEPSAKLFSSTLRVTDTLAGIETGPLLGQPCSATIDLPRKVLRLLRLLIFALRVLKARIPVLPMRDLHSLIGANWSDEQSVQILNNCRKVIPKNGRLLIVEAVVPVGNEPSLAKDFDIVMLIFPGGIERTEEEYRLLFKQARFQLSSITPTTSAVSVVEGRPM